MKCRRQKRRGGGSCQLTHPPSLPSSRGQRGRMGQEEWDGAWSDPQETETRRVGRPCLTRGVCGRRRGRRRMRTKALGKAKTARVHAWPPTHGPAQPVAPQPEGRARRAVAAGTGRGPGLPSPAEARGLAGSGTFWHWMGLPCHPPRSASRTRHRDNSPGPGTSEFLPASESFPVSGVPPKRRY